MRATTGSVASHPVPRLLVLGCALAVVAGCSGSSGGAGGSTASAPTGAAPTGAAPTGAAPTGAAPTAPTSPGGSGSSTVDATVSDVPLGEVADTPPGGQLFEIFVAGKRVAPKPGRHTVAVGQKVRIIVTTDKANVVHVHGADVERDIEPGKPLTIDFTIKDPGVYPIEMHEPELLLTQIVAR